jgi:hypothetical protein
VCLKTFIFTEVIPWPTAKQTLNNPNVFNPYTTAVNAIEQTAPSADDPKLLDLSLKLFDNDASRRTSIDSRAGTMMSAITLAATLVTGVGFTTLKDTTGLSSAVFWAIFVTFLLTLLYLTITTVLLFWIEGEIPRYTPDPRDVQKSQPANPSTYSRDVAVKVLRYTIDNYKVNNRVMDRLEIAQKCFRNALLVLVTGGIATVLLIFFCTGASSGLRLAQALAIEAGCTDLPNLTVDRKGRWVGMCLHSGKPTNVVINSDGHTEFPP